MKTKNKKRFWGLFCGYLFSILFLASGLVLSVTSALSLATINAGGKFNFIVPVEDESAYTGILKFYDPDSTASTISVCADPSTKSNSDYPSTVTIPNKIRVSGKTYTIKIVGSFSGCSNLQSITIPDSASIINSSIYSSSTGAGVTDTVNTFENCTNLQSITIPSGIQSIVTGAFNGCTALATMTVASGNTIYYSSNNAIITKANKTLVAGCKNTTIPNDVTAIGDRAFRKISTLTSITIPTSVKSLGSSAFAFSGLSSVSIPAGTTSIADNTFACSTSLGTISVDSANAKYKGEGNAIIEKATEKLIAGCRNTVIPSYVKEIGSYAFQGHPITSVTIPASTTIIDAYAFMGCSWLTSATFETDFGWKANGTAIDVASSTSTNATNLKTTHVSKTWIQATPTVDEYTDFAFTFFDNADGTYTASVRAKDTNTISGAKRIPTLVAKTAGGTDYVVNKIEANGFQGATNLTSIEIPDTIIEIEDYGFAASGLTSVVVPGSVKKLGEQAFGGGWGSGITSLQTITLNDGLETIGYAAFHTSGLTSITIPSTVTSIGDEAFYGCNNLQSVNILAQIAKIADSMFVECYKLTDFTMPDSIKEIGVTSFTDCTSLKTIRLSRNLEKIGALAFARSGLTSITIPASVTTIDNSYESVFDACDSLTSVTFENPVGWKEGDYYIYLGVPSQNAQYIVTDYVDASWTRGDSQIFDFTFNADSTASVKAYDNATINGGIVIPTLAMDNNGSTYTVNKVEDNGFAYQSDLTSVIFPASIRVIGESAFASTGLGEITLNEGLETISYQAFYQSSITSVSIPSSLTSLQAEAFYQCASLASVTFNSNSILTSIGENAFQETAISQIVIPNSVADIKTGAFLGCANLTNITIPENVTTIGFSAFQSSGLTSATFSKAYGWKAGDTIVDVSADTAQNATWLADTYAGETWTQSLPNEDFYSDFIFTFNDTNKTASVKARDTSTISGNKVIPSTVVKNGTTTFYTVTAIDASGFDGASNLTGITIPNSIITIGDTAFNASGLTSIAVPDSVSSIGAGAFLECTKLTSVSLGNGIETIPYLCFGDCSLLSSLTIPSSVKRIEEGVITGTAIKNIVIPNNVETLEISAFHDTNLENITLGTGITQIPESCFTASPKLKSITIPSNVVSIGSSAFHMTGLTSATFANPVGWKAGDYSIYLGVPSQNAQYLVKDYRGVTWTRSATDELFTFTFNSADKTASVKAKSASTISGEIAIPGLALNNGTIYTVTAIDVEGFYNARKLTGITIPSSVTSIGESAFYYCASLASVTLGTGITEISKYCFESCSALTTITIPSNVTSIGRGAFFGCASLASVSLGTGITEIPQSCFWGCSALTSITIPSSVTSIGEWAFHGSGLTSIIIPNRVTSIGNNAFNSLGLTSATFESTNGWTVEQGTAVDVTVPSQNATYLTSALVDSSWTRDSSATSKYLNFSYDFSTKEATLYSVDSTVVGAYVPELTAYNGTNYTVTTIGEKYSSVVSKTLQEITIPETVTSIRQKAFYQNSSLKKVTFASGINLTEIPELVFGYCTSLTDIVIPSSVTSIGKGAFYYCTSLTEFTIPSSVKSIGQSAFYGSGLTSITIPNSVTSIGSAAFYKCENLNSVTIGTGLKYIPESCFRNTALTSVTIPSNVIGIDILAFEGSKLTSATFANTSSWYYNGASISVTNTSTNATNLKTDRTTYPWERVFAASVNLDFTFSNYNSSTKTCSVAASGTSISGNIRIPGLVRYNSVIYKVTDIVAQGFKDCSNVTGLYIPWTIKSIGNYAFSGTSLETIEVALGNSTYKSVGTSGTETNSIIEKSTNTLVLGCKNTTIDTSVIKIGYGAFRGQLVENITIPENVKIIDEWAFYQTKQLDYVNVLGAVEIKYGAFAESAIQSISLPSTLVVIEERAFMNGSNKQSSNSITIPANIANIGANAFTESNFNRVTYEGTGSWKAGSYNVTMDTDNLLLTHNSEEWVISYYSYNSTLTFTFNTDGTASVKAKSTSISGQIVIPNKVYYLTSAYTVTKIDVEGFKDCANVTSVIIPSTITELGVRSFQSCKMSSLTLIEGLKIINDDALKATNIESLYIPSTVTSIITAFVDNPQLSKMEVDGANTTYYSSGNCIIEKSNMKVVGGCYNSQIPYGVKIIGAWAFSGKHTLTSITLPSTVTRIEKAAFGWSALTSITIPANVTFIQGQVFAGCTQLSSVTFKNKSGWRVDGVGSISVTNATQNATWIKHGGLYSNQDWTRS